MSRVVSLLAFLAAVAATATFGAQFEPGAWYAGLAKPAWTPPGWVFGPVWTVLYVLIAIAGWLVWQVEGVGAALSAWIVQLIFNAVWSLLMFGAHAIAAALVDIVLLWLAIAVFIFLAWQVSRPAALIFVPYWAWVTYAAALNFEIWRLNS
jgi:benzodiazapine receptor